MHAAVFKKQSFRVDLDICCYQRLDFKAIDTLDMQMIPQPRKIHLIGILIALARRG
jgi:hypothetical protein